MTTATVAAKGYRGVGMEGSVARWYEKSTRKDMGQFERLAERLAGRATRGWAGAGSGSRSWLPLNRVGSLPQVQSDCPRDQQDVCRDRAQERRGGGGSGGFRQGNASDMPFRENSFDLLVCRAAFKNFSEPEKALSEMQRVLRPGGIWPDHRPSPGHAHVGNQEVRRAYGSRHVEPLDDALYLSLHVAQACLHQARV